MKKQKLNIGDLKNSNKVNTILKAALKNVKGGYKGDPPPYIE